MPPRSSARGVPGTRCRRSRAECGRRWGESIEVYSSCSESDEPLRAEMYTVTRNPAYDDQMQRLQGACNALRDRVSELEREQGWP
jgi:hypothetical protein